MHGTVAVIILTLNEEANIQACLDSVADWAQQIFVVDSFSSDRTVEIVRSYDSSRVMLYQHAFKGYSAQWNWALDNLPITTAWTLKLDADERVPAHFKGEFARLAATAPKDVHGVLFRRLFFLFGRPVKRAGLLNYDLRLWRSGMARFDDREVNEHADVSGRTLKMKSVIHHVDNKPIAYWFKKHNQYTTLSARDRFAPATGSRVRGHLLGNALERQLFLKEASYHLPLRFIMRFFYSYFFRLGIMDGGIGFHFCILQSLVEYMTDIKVMEAQIATREPAKDHDRVFEDGAHR